MGRKPNKSNPERHSRLIEAREERGFASAADAARAFDWPVSTYTQHENGVRALSRQAAERYADAYNLSPGWLLYGDLNARNARTPHIRFGGVIGAGHRVVPSDDLNTTIPGIALPLESEAFEIAGDSQIPLAWPGDLVYFGPARPAARLIGQESLVELIDGERLFKTIARGSRPGVYDLTSYNAVTIRDVEIVKAGPFLGVIRRAAR